MTSRYRLRRPSGKCRSRQIQAGFPGTQAEAGRTPVLHPTVQGLPIKEMQNFKWQSMQVEK